MNRTGRSRTAWIAMAAIALVAGYAAALLLVPSRFMTTDAAKYVGIGRNVLDGAGPITPFGWFFRFHSPAWPIVVMAPEVFLGVDWTLWARFLNIAGAVGVLAVAGYLALPFGSRAAFIAVALFACYRYGFELARTLGLDEGAAVTTLAFTALALLAGRHRPTPWGVVVGVVFGIAFLIKEISLPLAPLPVLVVLLAGAGWRVALRLLGTYAGVAFLVVGWWFLLHASYTGTVYRLGTPAWTLVPIVILLAALFVVSRIVGRETSDPRSAAPGRRRRERLLAWGTAISWSLLLIVFFEHSQRGTGASLLRPGQYAFYLRTWGETVLPVAVVAVMGAIAAVVVRGRGRLDARQAAHIDGLVMALVMALPLAMVVVAVGELPRHYHAQVATLVALGAIGWDRLLALISARSVVAGRDARVRRWTVPIVLVIALVVPVVLVGRSAWQDNRPAATARDRVLATTVADVRDWLDGTLGPGDTVAIGSILSYEIATAVPRDTRIKVVREDQSVLPSPRAPLGVRSGDGQPNDDWIALEADRHDATSFYGYQWSAVQRRLRDLGVDIWIEGGIAPAGSRPPILAALDDTTGLEPARSWVLPYPGGRELHMTAYRVDEARLARTSDRLYLSGATLERLVSMLEAAPAESAVAARNLAARAMLVDGAQPELLARLEALAGG